MVRRQALACLAASMLCAPCLAQSPSLAEYFGFDGLEIVKIDDNPGPVAIADVNGDGHNDLVIVNNRKSRIEIHYLKPGAVPEDLSTATLDVNEIPEHWRYRRENVSVSHQVGGLVVHDFDGDGLQDIIYAGNPPTIVFLRQTAPGVFESTRRHNVRGLAPSRDGLVVADLIGDSDPELAAIVSGKIRIWPLEGDALGDFTDLPSGGNLVAILVEDYDGDGHNDIVGIIPDDPAPVRLWLASDDGTGAVLGSQRRFEMPPLREATAVRLAGDPAAKLAVIEQPSKRLVIYEAHPEMIESAGDRDASIVVYGFSDGSSRSRDVAVVDVDGDGLLDLVATDRDANALVVYRQAQGKGLQPGVSYPSYAEAVRLAAGNVDQDGSAEIFVLSEKEGVVGRTDASGEGLGYPVALPVLPGHTPVAINLVELEHGPHLAVVAKKGRNYVLDLIDVRTGESTQVDLDSQTRSPETIVALDADQDGRTDLLLFTPEKPMMMLRAGDDGFTLLESDDMGQFGLVQAAEARNIEVFDIDGNGRDELVIADKNFIRAVRYDDAPSDGASPGWQVVTQVNAADSGSKLVSVASLGRTIHAVDRENSQIIAFQEQPDGRWQQEDALTVRGFRFSDLKAGAFNGDGSDGLLAIGDDGFAVISLAGDRVGLREVAAWRADRERRLEHELASGDLNNDGFTDMVALDAGEQMAEIFTFSESGRLLPATEFQVYESRLFSAGDVREFQPREVFIADVTGDGLPDLVLLAHDRLLIYPQSVVEER